MTTTQAIIVIQEHIDSLEDAEDHPKQEHRLWGTMLHVVRLDMQQALNVLAREAAKRE